MYGTIQSVRMDTTIFKAYDIRGVYPAQLDDDAAYRIGAGFATSGLLPPGSTILVGRDMRESSDALFRSFVAGAMGHGIEVVDIGLCTTPMLYFAVNTLRAAGGAMITASHNPGRYNGFKLVRESAIPIGGNSGLEEIKRHALRHDAAAPAPGIAPPCDDSIAPLYVRYFSDRFRIQLDRPVIIDTGNGIAGPIVRRVLQDQRIVHDELFFEPDGRFPNHEANPLKEETLATLRTTVAETPDAIGVAFDGDGDRVCFVDEEGTVVRGDLLTALLSKRLLRDEAPATILYDLRSSRIVPEIIRHAGGEPVKTRVGHAFVKRILREQNALFGGELSYHFYFRDFFFCESGILAMLHVCRLLAETGERLVDLVAPFRKYFHSGEINFEVPNPQDTLRILENRFADGRVEKLDGLSVTYDDWWFNVRSSNTEPLLRLNIEAETLSLLRSSIRVLSQIIREGPRGDSNGTRTL